MLKLLLAAAVFVSVLAAPAYAAMIVVNVNEELGGNTSSFGHETETYTRFSIESYNTGSVGYEPRVRLDLYKDGDKFTAWSGRGESMPGDRENFRLYFFDNDGGEYDARVRVYGANEIFEQWFKVDKPAVQTSSNFRIENARTYNEFVMFDLVSDRAASDVVVMPSDYPTGWVFEQKELGGMKPGQKKTVKIAYEPSIWREANVTITVASKDGFADSSQITMVRKTGVQAAIALFIESFMSSKN